MIRECAIGDYRIYAGCGLALDGTPEPCLVAMLVSNMATL